MATTTEAPVTATQSLKRKCVGDDCENDADSLKCPTCLKQGKESYFCGQDCFKRNWATHKSTHKSAGMRSLFTPKVVSEPDPATGTYNPFPTFPYTGSIRPVYPLSPKREVPDSIPKPDYAVDGVPRSERRIVGRSTITILTPEQIEKMRTVCRYGREILDIAAAAIKPGVTTDYLDQIVHEETIKRKAYPSPLNYVRFPKSFCSSVNEVICHGIPDQRPLEDGDIVNLDISVYFDGFHSDLNETYYVGEKAKADPDSVRVVEAARECLNEAIKIVKPGTAFREFGNVIEKYAKSQGCSVIKTYCGHGVNQLFHTTPTIPHYAKNKAMGTCKPGMTFTIEPMIALGTYKDKTWPDDWTSVTQDGKRTAQFEHTLLVTEDGVDILTARTPTSPGGPMSMPAVTATNGS